MARCAQGKGQAAATGVGAGEGDGLGDVFIGGDALSGGHRQGRDGNGNGGGVGDGAQIILDGVSETVRPVVGSGGRIGDGAVGVCRGTAVARRMVMRRCDIERAADIGVVAKHGSELPELFCATVKVSLLAAGSALR